MNTIFRPLSPARARPSAPGVDPRPRGAFDLAWLNEHDNAEWQTRMLPITPAVETAVASVARGTLIATPDGQTAIEDLEPGMDILTARGTVVEIKWIGARTLPEGRPGEERLALYRVSVGAFGHRAPIQDLVLAEGACVLVRSPGCRKLIGQDEAFAPITAFEDSYNVTRIAPIGEITVYNMAFEGQEAVVANGLPVESFHPGRNTMQYVNDDVLRDMARLFPHLAGSNGFGPQQTLHLSVTEARSLELF